MSLSISNIINISVQETPVGLGDYNVNNIGFFTSDQFLSNPNYDLYRVYVSAQDVGTDFGTDSETYAQAVALFSQQPNILAGGGNLIIFPSFQPTSISTVAITAGGTGYKVGDVVEVVETGASLGYLTVSTVYAGVVTGLTVTKGGIGYSTGAGKATSGGSGSGLTVNITALTTETLLQAIARCYDLIFFVGILSTDYPSSASMLALANSVESYQNKILFLPSSSQSDITGAFTDIKDAADNNTRCLFYSASALDARLFAAAYAGKAMSVNFDGSLTANTMNLKQLATITADSGITQTLYNTCKTAGVDIYPSYAGVPGVLSTGANKYFDEVFNLVWFVSQLTVNGFNALALVATKVPQTEAGVSVLVGAYRQVCEQALNNGYIAPGTWTSPNTFGNQEAFLANITQRGYYIYSNPVALQSAADRAARKAPLIQIAIKESGAIQSSDVLVYVNP
ncbi:DUF3383 family protein [Candidatus Dependentiae bacterium]|nr:MAG: DUF3383 family protein [Candidatus Dependentiae bacterium]